MTYILPILYVIVSYTFFLLAGLFDTAVELQILSILLPFIMGVVNLITVLTVGRKWSRRTLLNCTLIIKYGLIPFYLIGGSITIGVTVMAIFPLPLMALFGLVTIVFLIFGYGILLGAAPYAIAYLVYLQRIKNSTLTVRCRKRNCIKLLGYCLYYPENPILFKAVEDQHISAMV